MKTDFLEALKQYFEKTPRSKVMEDWAKTEAFDQIVPTMDLFLETTQNYNIATKDPSQGTEILKHKFSPEFTSGFFLINNPCKKQLFQ